MASNNQNNKKQQTDKEQRDRPKNLTVFQELEKGQIGVKMTIKIKLRQSEEDKKEKDNRIHVA